LLVPRSVDRNSRPGAVEMLLTSEATAGRCALVVLEWERGFDLPRHRHGDEDELLFILAGEVLVEIGEMGVRASPGSAVFVPRGTDHRCAALTNRPRVLAAYLPAGFEGFFREAADLAADDLDRLIATAARYGCEVTGPPLEPLQIDFCSSTEARGDGKSMQ
jgi:quercetin dioxygenase-like cupin family protein